ncbi:hypothetical protein NDU88_005108 [Pleurodeles waltl]|uniref:Uncharacterized protein n=1 Tax=Pleurodeles waltl TaxID=8319 RepID=A0AAV7PEF2_PLEWA|nr:hypothetical protein NDU88_005108 [Pleurodeles waltl]
MPSRRAGLWSQRGDRVHERRGTRAHQSRHTKINNAKIPGLGFTRVQGCRPFPATFSHLTAPVGTCTYCLCSYWMRLEALTSTQGPRRPSSTGRAWFLCSAVRTDCSPRSPSNPSASPRGAQRFLLYFHFKDQTLVKASVQIKSAFGNSAIHRRGFYPLHATNSGQSGNIRRGTVLRSTSAGDQRAVVKDAWCHSNGPQCAASATCSSTVAESDVHRRS